MIRRIILIVVGVAAVVALTLGISSAVQPAHHAAAPQRPAAPSASQSAKPAAQPAAPNPSASAASAAPAGGATCDQVPTLPAHWLGYTLKQPAGDQAALDALPAVKTAGLDLAAYAGASVDADTMAAWVRTAQCNGLSVGIDPDPMFGDVVAGQAFVKKVASNQTVKIWIVDMNEVGDGSPAAVNGRVKAIQDAGTGLPVFVLTDQFSTSLAKNAAQTRAYHANLNVTGYFPDAVSDASRKNYGDESSLPMDAKTAVQINGNSATGAVQAFSWWKSEPGFAAQMGFDKKDVVPDDTARMAKAQTDAGDSSMLIVDEEPTADDITGHVVPTIKAVKAACPALGS